MTSTTARGIEAFINERLSLWKEGDFQDGNLWDAFVEEFDGYTKEDFKSIDTAVIRRLRDYLRKRGVWIQKNIRIGIAETLYNTLQEEEPKLWTDEEILRCHEKEKFDSFRMNERLANWGIVAAPATTSPAAPAPLAAPAVSPAAIPAASTVSAPPASPAAPASRAAPAIPAAPAILAAPAIPQQPLRHLHLSIILNRRFEGETVS